MKSRIPKALHRIAGRDMLSWVQQAISETPVATTVSVVGPEFPADLAHSPNGMKRVVQAERLGTGHALLQTEPVLVGSADHMLVLNADMPLISSETLGHMMDRHMDSESAMTLLTCDVEDPGQMGRVVRGEQGEIVGVVEWRDAGPAALASNEVCCGAYCFRTDWLWPALRELQPAPTGEYYITALVDSASRDGVPVQSVTPVDAFEAMGVNDRADLARVTAIAFDNIRQRLMAKGVTLVDPVSTFVDDSVQVGMDTQLHPGVILQGKTSIGEGCEIGPNAVIRDSSIGNDCRIHGSVIEESSIADRVDVGPYCHLRPGACLAEGVHIGNYVEVKETVVGRDTKVGHFSYLGDAEVGASVNIGAGTVTCNYDGSAKHRTVIQDGAFIGSGSMLVAPVKVGARAVTGAGSVVTKDLPEGVLAFGVPAREKARMEGC